MAATVQEQLQLPSSPKLASELEAIVEPFIITDLDRLFARRLSLALDTQRVEPSQILSVHQAINQLDKQISERMQEQTAISYQKEKALEQAQGYEKKEGTNISKGSLQLEAEGSAAPVAENEATFEQTVTSHPTISPRLLHFTTDNTYVSNIREGYHVATTRELDKLNYFSPMIQDIAKWYQENLSSSELYYFIHEEGKVELVTLSFEEKNLPHLLGILPIGKNQTAEKTFTDLVEGRGHFSNILLADQNNTFKKLGVLPNIKSIIDTSSFYFDNLEEVKRFNRMNVSTAIQAEDEDMLLAFRTVRDVSYPASLLRVKGGVQQDIVSRDKKAILGIFRERDGIIEQLSIHPDYVKDGGQSMMTVLQNKQYETLSTLQTMQEEIKNTERLSDTLQDEPALPVPMMDSDADGISDEEEKKQGSNPYDFRSQPATKHQEEREEKEVEDSSLVVANLIQNQDIAGLNRHLKDGIKDYLDSDKYKDYLTKMSQLNNYSSRNLRLILAQQPTASQVASFKQWKETFGRHVKKGEKALRIFVPITYIKKDENNQPILDKDGKPEIGTTFRLKAAVFDVSQTDGKEMPKAVSDVKDQLTDQDYGNLYRTLMTIAKNNHVSVRFEELEESRKGYYDTANHQIVLNKVGMNKSQLIKTFLHETAHSELHHKDHPQKDQLTRSTAELQAESVAYVVASYYGLDTSNYSFGYLASWSQDKDTLRDLEAQLDIVQQEAKSLIERMDKEMEVLRLSQTKQTQHQFENKLNHFKEQSDKQLKELQEKRQAEATSKKEKGISK
ncbi:TPA: hypothetical protein U1C40_002296 [Streptococcus suis]|nr:hypothetical protein [Streptococcus suis]